MVIKQKVMFALFLLTLVVSVLAIPLTDFISPTLSNNAYTTNTNVEINVSIIEANLSEVKYNWNGTNYTYYNDSLVLMYNFDNVSALGENNTYVVDSAGINNGTVHNGSLSTPNGRYDGAFTFDGVDDLIEIPTITFAGEFTISFWWKIIHDNAYRAAISEDSTGTSAKIAHANDGSSFFIRVINGGSSDSSVSLPSENEWHHISIVRDSSDKVDLYIDASQPTRLFSDAAQSGNSLWSVIGRGSSDIGQHMNGTLDEFRIWNRSLSADEVYQQYVSNLKKVDSDSWELYVNQSKNATNGLNDGTYTYQTFATSTFGSLNSTPLRTLTVDTTFPSINFTSPKALYIITVKYGTNNSQIWYK